MQVTIRTLKTRLSEYVRRAQAGETVIVTSHGHAVAQLTPPPSQDESPVSILRRQPWIAVGESGATYGLEVPVVMHGDGPSISELLLEDRE